MTLPPGAYAIKSANLEKYLHCTPDGTLLFSEKVGTDLSAKFEVEEDKDQRDLVNIKSSNGKYWRRESESSYAIVSKADAPDGDQSSWQCTLFKIPKKITAGNRYQIFHIQLKGYIEPNPNDRDRAYVSTTSKDQGNEDVVFEGR